MMLCLYVCMCVRATTLTITFSTSTLNQPQSTLNATRVPAHSLLSTRYHDKRLDMVSAIAIRWSILQLNVT